MFKFVVCRGLLYTNTGELLTALSLDQYTEISVSALDSIVTFGDGGQGVGAGWRDWSGTLWTPLLLSGICTLNNINAGVVDLNAPTL